jgi:hypothetical protein
VVQAGAIERVILPARVEYDPLPVPRQLPVALPAFTGRAETVTFLDDLISVGEEGACTTTVVVVGGTAGVGKTTLIVQWAHRVQHRFPVEHELQDLGCAPTYILQWSDRRFKPRPSWTSPRCRAAVPGDPQ